MTSASSHNQQKRTRLLETISSPQNLKAIDEEALPELAKEIRQTLIEVLSKTGGHIGPNLGVVELTIALHKVFETPKDKFVFDVSHQGYIHKMLSGRQGDIATIRQYQGLSGFLLRTESEHDCYGAGHAGTALSAALGMAAARDLKGTDEHIVVVAGDAAFTCGVSYEALNNVAHTTNRFIVVLNDNEWSIARNVGAIANYFNRFATSPAFAHLRERASHFIKLLLGKGILEWAHKVEESVKHILLPSVIFEDLGLHYYGPIDGHNIPLLIRTFEFLKTQEEPVILHVLTQKGKGYPPALKQPDKFHGLGKFKAETGETTPSESLTYSQHLGIALSKFAETEKRLVAITAAMPSGTGLSAFQKKHPKRYFDVGIAEEHAALFACGLATQGMKPFLAIYSTFMQRAYDMIIHDIALQKLNVALCMDRAGLSSDDGPTHHGLFDIGYLRHIPNIVHMQPKDEDEFIDMLYTMLNYDGPIAIRYPRGIGRGIKPKEQPSLLEIGKAQLVEDGDQIAIIGLGNMFELAEQAASQLKEQGYSVALVNPRWIKPLDESLLDELASKVEVICTIEDHVLHNGFGCAVIEHLSQCGYLVPVVRVGWPDAFVEHGSLDILRSLHGITVEGVLSQLEPFLQEIATKPERVS